MTELRVSITELLEEFQKTLDAKLVAAGFKLDGSMRTVYLSTLTYRLPTDVLFFLQDASTVEFRQDARS